MKTRNAIYNENGTIDCDINHPKFGWIPFLANPDDPEKHGRDIHAELIVSGSVSAYVPPTKAELDIISAKQLEQDKATKKSELIKEKMSLLLVAEFAEIDTAIDKASINAVWLK